jgi:hypothetical protein
MSIEKNLVKQQRKILMISSETPYKLAEIIRDTWPGLYNPPKKSYNTSTTDKQNDTSNR